MPRDMKRISEGEEYFNIYNVVFSYSYFLYSGLEINPLTLQVSIVTNINFLLTISSNCQEIQL